MENNKPAVPVAVPPTYMDSLLSGAKNLVAPIADRYQEMRALDTAAQLTPEQKSVLAQQSVQTGLPFGNLQALQMQQNVQGIAPGGGQLLAPETGTSQPLINENSLNSAEHFEPLSQVGAPAVSQAKPQQSALPGQINSSFAKQQQATKAVAEAQALKFEAEANQRDLFAKEQQQKELEYQQQAQQMEERSSTEIAKLQSVQEQMSKFEFKDYWADKSSGQRAMAAIAIALGGIGAAYQGNGAKNRGLEAVNGVIERDLNLQKLQYEKLKGSGEMSKSIFGLMNQQFDNKTQAMTATRMFMNDRMANKISEITSKYGATEVRERGIIAVEGLKQQNAVLQEQFKQAAKQQALLDQVSDPASADMRNLSSAQVQQLDKAYKGFADRYVPGYGEATNPEQAKEFNKYRASVEPAIKGAERILQASKDLNRITDLSKRAEIATEIKALVGQLRLPFTGPGAMTEKEYDRLLDVIGDPNKLMALPALERVKLNTVLKKLQTDMNNQAKNSGLRPVEMPTYFKPIK